MHQARLDRVVFMPAGDPWQKLGRRVSPGRHRLEMTRIAIAGVDGFAVDSREVDRGGLTYTVDTLATFPDDEELFLILGADAAMGLPTWNRVEEVLGRVTVIVAPRPGTDSRAVTDVVPDAIFLDMAVLEVSGTAIRRLSTSGQPYRFLVTPGVHRYAEEHQLYAHPREDDMVEAPLDTEERS